MTVNCCAFLVRLSCERALWVVARVRAVAGGCQSVGDCASWTGACCVCGWGLGFGFSLRGMLGRWLLSLTNLFAVGCMAKLRFFSETCKRSVCIFAFLRAKKWACLSSIVISYIISYKV